MSEQKEAVELFREILPDEQAEVVRDVVSVEADIAYLKAMAETADDRVKWMRQIMKASIAATNPQDWVDQGGRPYGQCTAAEKIASLWGVNWRILDVKKEVQDARYIYFTRLLLTVSKWGRQIEVIGTRKSDDPFFTTSYVGEGEERHKVILPTEEVDEPDVMKASYTNALVGGITRMFGLRNLTWEDLAQYGIKREDTQRVEYRGTRGRSRSGPLTDEEKEKQTEIRIKLTEMCGGDAKAALAKLMEVSTFKGGDGEMVQGVSSFEKLRGRRLDVNLGKVKSLYAAWQKENKSTEGAE